MPDWPSLRWPELRRVLMREPLRYRLVKSAGSHGLWESDRGYPPLRLAFHEQAEIPPGLVRSILTRGVGLTEVDALRLL